MTIGSLSSVGPVRAAELGLLVRNDAAQRREETPMATVEIVRAVDAATMRKADADVIRSVPETERLRIDIRV